MDQLSRPLLIVLAATILLLAVWLLALRPRVPDVSGTPLAPVQSVAQAERASAVSDAANARTQEATGEAPSAPSAAPVTKPAAAPTTPGSSAGPDKSAEPRDAAVLRDIRRGKVVVLLFWTAKGADDVATRDAVRGLDRHRGKVALHVVPISRVGAYESIMRGVTVNQSPTTLVIDRRRRARAIVGLSEPRELSQAVGDALAAG
jgi:hypothetical protein